MCVLPLRGLQKKKKEKKKQKKKGDGDMQGHGRGNIVHTPHSKSKGGKSVERDVQSIISGTAATLAALISAVTYRVNIFYFATLLIFVATPLYRYTMLSSLLF